MPENIKIKRTVKTILPGSLQSKGLQLSAANKGLLGSVKVKVLQESITDLFKVLSEYNNKKIALDPMYCQEVPQTSQSLRKSGVLCVRKLFVRKFLLMFCNTPVYNSLCGWVLKPLPRNVHYLY